MKTPDKIIAALVASLCVLSCSYKPEVKGVDTSFEISVSELKGTQLRVSVVPSNDICWYYFDVVSLSDYEEYLRESGNDQKLMQSVIDSAYTLYKDLVEVYRDYLGAKYVGDFDDIALYFGTNSLYFTGLTPETDYYVICFSIDPVNRKPVGPLNKYRFRTTAISPELSKMSLDFLLQDGSECLYYYTKPTIDGAICREPYLVDIVSDEELKEYEGKGGLVAYARDWYYDKLEKGLIDYYLRNDISRNEYYDIDRMAENKGYTVFGAPYNIRNLEEGTLFSLHFVYKPGMTTKKYAHDLMQSGD